MKRVAINAVILHEKSGGLGIYIQKLIDYLTCHKLDFEPVIFLSNEYYRKNPDFSTNPFIHVLNISPYQPVKRIFREPLIWPRVLKKHEIDLFFSPMSYIPLGVNIPSLFTVYDLRSYHFKEYFTLLRLYYLRKMIRRSVKIAEKIINIKKRLKR